MDQIFKFYTSFNYLTLLIQRVETEDQGFKKRDLS